MNLYIISIPITLIGIYDVLQKKHIILRNYPVLGHFRFLLESIRPEIQQYFIEEFDEGRPFSREHRSLAYQRAKKEIDSAPFGTLHDLYSKGSEWMLHTMKDTKRLTEKDLRVKIGNSACKQPYLASRLNISAMSYGALSKNAIKALNKAACMGSFYHNTGEGGLSDYHLSSNSDVVWQIGTAYFGCRKDDGSFCPELFKESALKKQVKMIEIKISQGAKPGHGGLLPANKVDAEIASIRKIKMGKDVHSPGVHKEFDSPIGLIKFITRLRDLSEGKPVGFKICIGDIQEFYSICKAMIELDTYPDFITVDGAEGGTGAAPVEFSNTMGTPLLEALNFVNNTLVGLSIRDKIRIIASGKVIDGFSLLNKVALGADLCNSARGMMFSIGCIQSLRCNTNSCPTGVATTDPKLYKLLDVESKAMRAKNFHNKTIEMALDLLKATGHESFNLSREKFVRRIHDGSTKNYADLYAQYNDGDILNSLIDQRSLNIWQESSAHSFS